MQTRKIGSLDVSVVGLGCNNFGWRLDAGETAAVVDAAIDAGVNFFDTADIYGQTKSEEYLGHVLQGRRESVILATKFGLEVDPTKKGARPEYVKQAAEDSLRRLKTEYIDLYQLHRPDPTVPIADTLGALNELVQAGKVREIGCSNFSVAQLEEAAAAVRDGGARFESVQNHYSVLQQGEEKDVLAYCEQHGLGYLPYFPLASGLLSGKYRKGQAVPQGTRIQEDSDDLNERNLDIVENLISFAEAQGHSILDLAFSWLLAQRAVASVIAGATKAEQIQRNAVAAGWALSDADLAEIDRIVQAG